MADKIKEFNDFQIEKIDNTNIGFVNLHLDFYTTITNAINNIIDDTNRNFYRIGLLLFLSKITKNYCVNNYKNVYEYAEDVFHIKSTTCKNLIKIVEKFSSEKLFNDLEKYKTRDLIYFINGSSKYLDNTYMQYNYSQLLQMTKLTDEELKEITPNNSSREIKDIIVSRKIDEFIDSEKEIYSNILKELENTLLIHFPKCEYVKDFKEKYFTSFQYSKNYKIKVPCMKDNEFIYFKLKYLRTLKLDNRYPQVELIISDPSYRLDNKILMQLAINDEKIIKYFSNVLSTSFVDLIKNRRNEINKIAEENLTKIDDIVSKSEEPVLEPYDHFTCEFDEYFILKTFVLNNEIKAEDKIYNDSNYEFISLNNSNKLKFSYYSYDSDYFDITKNDKCYHIDKFKFFDYLAQKMKELNIGYDSYINDKIDEVIIYEKDK